MERIGTVRKVGYAMDDEENEEGVRCIAVSIPDYHKEPVYALSISRTGEPDDGCPDRGTCRGCAGI